MRTLLVGAAAAALLATACNKASSPAVSSSANPENLPPQTVVATYDGKQVTLGELDATLAKDFYELRRQALESMILRRLVEAEAKKAGKTEEQFLKDLMEKSAPAGNDEELRKIYEDNKAMFGGKTFEEVKPMLQASQGNRQGQEAVMAYLDELKKKNNVQITLPEPRTQVAAVGPSKGPKDAPVTIVEFSDFQCPYCSKARQTADQIVANYAGKVRLVFRDFPLPFHDKAQKAAEAGLCAEEQGKFWEMHDWMFDHQDKLAVEELKAAAKELKLDNAKFDGCLDSGKMAAKVQESMKAAKEAGVSGTPAFFVNGRLLSGAQPYEEFRQVIEQELKGK